jgi:hypothetical protein
MNLAQLKAAKASNSNVYYAQDSTYAYFRGDRPDLPGAPYSVNTRIPRGKIDRINVSHEYDSVTDTWTENVIVSCNGQTLAGSRCYASSAALKTALKNAIQGKIDGLAAIATTLAEYRDSVDEIGIPVLVLSESELDFGDAEISLPFGISNTGDGELDYTITTSLPDKVTVDISSGALLGGETDTITVTVSRSGVPSGTYNPTINIAGDVTGEVALTVIVP